MTLLAKFLDDIGANFLGSLSSNGDASYGLSKGFLNFSSKYRTGSSAKRVLSKKNARSLYAAYLDEFIMVGMDINLNCFNRWSRGKEKFYSSLYGKDDTAEPKNFSVKNHFDVCRVGELLGQNIVIYFLAEPPLSDPRAPVEEGLDLLYQFSDSFSREMFSSGSIVTVTYLLTSSGRIYHVLKHDLLNCLVQQEIIKKFCARGMQPVTLRDTGLGEALCRLLEVDDCYATCPVLSKINSTSQFVLASREVKSVLDTIDVPLVLSLIHI